MVNFGPIRVASARRAQMPQGLPVPSKVFQDFPRSPKAFRGPSEGLPRPQSCAPAHRSGASRVAPVPRGQPRPPLPPAPWLAWTKVRAPHGAPPWELQGTWPSLGMLADHSTSAGRGVGCGHAAAVGHGIGADSGVGAGPAVAASHGIGAGHGVRGGHGVHTGHGSPNARGSAHHWAIATTMALPGACPPQSPETGSALPMLRRRSGHGRPGAPFGDRVLMRHAKCCSELDERNIV